MMKASVVILSWNSTEVLGPCLASLPQGFTSQDYEVIIIDNGSRGLTPAALRCAFPWVQLVVNRKNRGVAPARNQGMRLARGEYIILLDDDTLIRPGVFAQLLAYMDAHPDVGVCGPKLIDLQGRLQLSCRFFPTMGDKLARRFPFTFAQQVRRAAEMADWDHSYVREVDYVIGACQVIRRAALAEVGLLDERIFYGPEDIDLCLRMRQAGWRVVYNPEAVVVHHERRVARSFSSRLGWKHLWGVLYYFAKHGYLFSRQRLYARLHGRRRTISAGPSVSD
ncbi:MAG TPA: glycosyltransferase family 2 protein [Candidatus Binatia bacterium]|nr:glycosyltransferase family 2 protein [Candidatus Binatia bacterium]